MPLTPEGKELLLSAKEHILANPKFYDQDDIANPTACGTVCCIAGWIDYLRFGPKAHEDHVRIDKWGIWDSSAKLLGLSEDESDKLFEGSHCHPDKEFSKEYETAYTDSERAKAAGRMIDRFIIAHS